MRLRRSSVQKDTRGHVRSIFLVHFPCDSHANASEDRQQCEHKVRDRAGHQRGWDLHLGLRACLASTFSSLVYWERLRGLIQRRASSCSCATAGVCDLLPLLNLLWEEMFRRGCCHPGSPQLHTRFQRADLNAESDEVFFFGRIRFYAKIQGYVFFYGERGREG